MTARDLIKALECCDLDKDVVILVTMPNETSPFVVFKSVVEADEMESAIMLQ